MVTGSSSMTIAERLARFAARASFDDLDHSQIVQLECLRAGIWGTADLWGNVVTYKA